VPLHTIRADIDFGRAEAHTTFGRIGVKVWIYKGESIEEKPVRESRPIEQEEGPAPAAATVAAVVESVAQVEEPPAAEPETKEA
jgi:small subunit ribosomal protein S3